MNESIAGSGHELRDLQSQQQRHDERHHAGVLVMTLPDRMTHYVLHLCSYSGQLALIEGRDASALKKIMSKALIITLCASNALGSDVSIGLLGEVTAEHFETIQKIGQRLVRMHGPQSVDGTGEWVMRRIISATGPMADACQAIAHGRTQGSRDIWQKGTLELARNMLIADHMMGGLDLGRAIHDLWAEDASPAAS